MTRLERDFFARDTHTVAKELLGKVLVRRWRGNIFKGRIAEVESYVGENDKACHASRGMTARNEVMFGEAGLAYVYLIYGMHHCLNVVTERYGFPAAVLIRSVVMPPLRTDGPGRLTRAMHITRALNGEDLTNSRRLWIANDGFAVSPEEIVAMERIGVEYAGEDARLKWRYLLHDPLRLPL